MASYNNYSPKVVSNENCECEESLVEYCMDVGANLERDVLSNGLDPVGDELVDDVPWVVSPFSYTVYISVYICVE